jgi:hypothetical protein
LRSPTAIRHERGNNAPQWTCSGETDSFTTEKQKYTSSTKQQCPQDNQKALQNEMNGRDNIYITHSS